MARIHPRIEASELKEKITAKEEAARESKRGISTQPQPEQETELPTKVRRSSLARRGVRAVRA